MIVFQFFREWNLQTTLRQPSDIHLKQFGQNIIRLRNETGLTQEKVAEKTGISWRYFQSIEAGKRWPTIVVLMRLKAALGCDWAAIFDGLR